MQLLLHPREEVISEISSRGRQTPLQGLKPLSVLGLTAGLKPRPSRSRIYEATTSALKRGGFGTDTSNLFALFRAADTRRCAVMLP